MKSGSDGIDGGDGKERNMYCIPTLCLVNFYVVIEPYPRNKLGSFEKKENGMVLIIAHAFLCRLSS